MVIPILQRRKWSTEIFLIRRSPGWVLGTCTGMCVSLSFWCVLHCTVQQEHLLQMEVSFLRLSSRELHKKSSEKKRNGYQEPPPPLLPWRRGSLAISRHLALNLYAVLTALVIRFLRWQIRYSKLQVGRLLVAGTLVAEATADGKGG